MLNQFDKNLLDKNGPVYSVLSLVQSWHISVEQAIDIVRKILQGEPFEIPENIENIFNTKEWEAVVVDEISIDWPRNIKYSFFSVRAGDKVLLLRKKQTIK
jgi:hypothetical protein